MLTNTGGFEGSFVFQEGLKKADAQHLCGGGRHPSRSIYALIKKKYELAFNHTRLFSLYNSPSKIQA